MIEFVVPTFTRGATFIEIVECETSKTYGNILEKIIL
jgi:hypothetical protein